MAKRNLTVNGARRTVDLPDEMPLLWALRDELGLTGTRYGCGEGACGACTVLIDGQPARSCLTPVSAVSAPVTTIEGLEKAGGAPLQKAWIETDVSQCGYCQAGLLLTTWSRLKAGGSEAEVLEALEDNLCRCGSYPRAIEAIRTALRGRNGSR